MDAHAADRGSHCLRALCLFHSERTRVEMYRYARRGRGKYCLRSFGRKPESPPTDTRALQMVTRTTTTTSETFVTLTLRWTCVNNFDVARLGPSETVTRARTLYIQTLLCNKNIIIYRAKYLLQFIMHCVSQYSLSVVILPSKMQIIRGFFFIII